MTNPRPPHSALPTPPANPDPHEAIALWRARLALLQPFCAQLVSDTGLTRTRTSELDRPLRLRQSTILGETGTFESIVRSSLGSVQGPHGFSWILRDNQMTLRWCSRSGNIKAILNYVLIESRDHTGLVIDRPGNISIAVHRGYLRSGHATTLLNMAAEKLPIVPEIQLYSKTGIAFMQRYLETAQIACHTTYETPDELAERIFGPANGHQPMPMRTKLLAWFKHHPGIHDIRDFTIAMDTLRAQ